MTLFKNIKLQIAFIFFLTSLIILIWFNKGLLFAGGEEALSYYNPERSFKLFSSTWYDVGTGLPLPINLAKSPYFLLTSVFTRLGFNQVVLQALTFWFLMTTGTLSVYFLIKKMLFIAASKSNQELVAFISAIFYLLNPFSMSQVWGRGLSMQFFGFALVPLFLFFFIMGIDSKKFVFAVYASLASFVLSSTYSHPALVVTSWSPIIVYFLFYIVFLRKRKQSLIYPTFYLFLFFAFWFLANAFWIFPLVKTGNQLLSTTLSVQNNLSSLQGVSRHATLVNLLRLIHSQKFNEDVYGRIYGSLSFVLLSWFIPIFVLLGVMRIIISRKKTKALYFYLMLMLLSLFICLGSNPPTGYILVLIFNKFPILYALRSPYEKFGINLVISCAPLFSLGLLYLSKFMVKILRKKFFYILFSFIFLFLVCGVFVWPIWTGKFAGGIKSNPWVEVPDYYRDANQWLNKQEGDFRILQLPLIPGDGVRYKWEHSFQGIEPSEFLFDKQSIGRDIYHDGSYYSVLFERFGKKAPSSSVASRNNQDFRSETVVNEIQKLNVSYLVLHNDIDYQFSGSESPLETKNFLDSLGIKKEISFGDLDIYKVPRSDKIGFIFSPVSEVSYEKVNATFYKIRLRGHTEEIVLLNRFDKGWILSGSNTGIIPNHFEKFSYANSWKVDGINDTLFLRYAPQDFFITGTKISVSFLVLSLGFLILNKLLSLIHHVFLMW